MFGFGVPDITSFVGDGFQECVDCARKRYPDRDSQLFTEGIPEDYYRPVYSHEDNYPWTCECGHESEAYESLRETVEEYARQGVGESRLGDWNDNVDDLGHGLTAFLTESAVGNAVCEWLDEGNNIEDLHSRLGDYPYELDLRAKGVEHGNARLTEYLDHWAEAIKAEHDSTYDGDLFTQAV